MGDRPVRAGRFFSAPLLCASALLLGTLTLGQHALDANLRVGSGGRNTHRAPQVTMTRSPYYVGKSGDMVYNRAVAFNDPVVYSRPMARHQQNIGSIDPKPLGWSRTTGRARPSSSVLARPQYSASNSARALMATPRSIHSPAGAPTGATITKQRYSASSQLSALQLPSASLQRQRYSASRSRQTR